MIFFVNDQSSKLRTKDSIKSKAGTLTSVCL